VPRRVTDLIPYARNARTHSDAQVAQIAASIKEFGFTNPVLTHGDDILAGHGRVLAARKLGMATVPTIDLSHLTKTQARAYTLADNQLSLNAGWEAEMLALELAELDADGFDLDLLGFPDVTGLMNPESEGGLVPGVDEDAVPEPPKVPITKPGDIITLGRHRLMCGDSTVITDLERLMDGANADMVWTDPPYGVDMASVNSSLAKYGKANKTRGDHAQGLENDNLSEEDLIGFLRSALGCAWANCRAGASWYVSAPADSRHHCFSEVMQELGVWRQTLNWVKNTFLLGRSDYHYRHEPIFYGWKEGAAHYFVDDHTQDTILEFDKPRCNDVHPTMKPVALIERCIENSSKPGQTVLDPFGGSGSTLIAAEKTGRTAYLMELDPIYCDVIVARWELATGQKAVRP
jgi:DNA modification methylase